MTKRGLGRGLDLLIPAGDEKALGYQEVPLTAITPNPYQPRQSFPDPDLDELAASIQEHGILQPLIVVQELDGSYRLIAGERRWRAAQKAGLSTVPVIIKDAAPQEMLELALVENLQRADLNPLEQAIAYQYLAEQYQLSQSAIAQRVGKSRVAVVNVMRLLDAAPAVQKMLLEGKITEGHGRALLGLNTHEEQESALQIVLDQAYTVRQTEALVRRWRVVNEYDFSEPVRDALLAGEIDEVYGQLLAKIPVNSQADVLRTIFAKQLTLEQVKSLVEASVQHPSEDKESGQEPSTLSPEIKAIEQRFEQALGTRVRLRANMRDGKRGGHLVIYYYSDEEFQSLYQRLVGEEF